MKNKHLLCHLLMSMLLLSGLVTLNSCSYTDLDELSSPAINGQGETVTLQIAASDTRTALEEGGRVIWTDGDRVNINGTDYPVVPDPEDPSLGTIPNVPASDSYLAYYSFDFGHTSDNEVTCQWATSQPYVADGFAPNSCPMVAYSTGEPLYFRQVGGLLKFGLTSENHIEVSHIQLETDYVSSCFISDPAVLASGELSYIPLPDKTTNTFELTFDTPVALDPTTPRWFYICLPPATYTTGFRFSIRTNDGITVVKPTTPGNSYTIESGKIYTLPALSYEAIYDSIPLTATIDNATGPFVEYTLSSKPHSMVISTIMRKQEFDQATPEMLLEKLGQGYRTDSDATGSCSIQPVEPFPASTECVLVYAYLDGDQIVGTPETLFFRVNDALQPAPKMTITEIPTASPTSQYAINLQTDIQAVDLSFILLSQDEYNYITDLYPSPLDIFFVNPYLPSILMEDELYQVATPEGYDLQISNTLTPATDYVLLLLAYGADGAITLEQHHFKTDTYIDPDATWVPVSTSATMECGIFSPLGFSQLMIEGLTVEKLEDRDLFRIVDPFALERLPELANSDYNLKEVEGQSYNMLIDATNPADVIVNIGANQLNLLIWGVAPMHIATYNHWEGVEMMSPSTYDAASGTIHFPENSLGLIILGLNYRCAATTIHLNR